MAEIFIGKNGCYLPVGLAAVNLCDLVNPVFAQFGADLGRVMGPGLPSNWNGFFKK
jgi:hypothetical protein